VEKKQLKQNNDTHGVSNSLLDNILNDMQYQRVWCSRYNKRIGKELSIGSENEAFLFRLKPS
jgi:hypothetical protein